MEIADAATHMPAILVVKGRPHFLFCIGIQQVWWKSYYTLLDGSTPPRRIGFNNGPRINECSPDGYEDEAGNLHLSITQEYRLVHYTGASLDRLEQVEDFGPCISGTVLPDRYIICRTTGADVLVFSRDHVHIDTITAEALGLKGLRLVRITFLCEDPDFLVFTGTDGGRDRSTLYQQSTRRAWKITRNGNGIYKCTIYKGVLYYARRASAMIDDRVLVMTSNFELTPI